MSVDDFIKETGQFASKVADDMFANEPSVDAVKGRALGAMAASITALLNIGVEPENVNALFCRDLDRLTVIKARRENAN